MFCSYYYFPVGLVHVSLTAAVRIYVHNSAIIYYVNIIYYINVSLFISSEVRIGNARWFGRVNGHT